MRSLGVVVDAPSFDDAAGVGEVDEPVFVQAFDAEFSGCQVAISRSATIRLSFTFSDSSSRSRFTSAGSELAEPPAPDVDRLFADFVLLDDLRDRGPIRLAEDPDHLFFGESNFLHQLLASSAGAIVSSYDWAEKPGQVMGDFVQHGFHLTPSLS